MMPPSMPGPKRRRNVSRQGMGGEERMKMGMRVERPEGYANRWRSGLGLGLAWS